MDIKIVTPTPTDTEVLEESQKIDPGILEGTNDGEINTLAAYQVLDIERDDRSRYSKEISTLVEWAKQTTGSSEHQELQWAIRDLKMKLSTPLHEDRIKYLARFAYLDLEEKRIKKEKASFD
jgi:hypothetical protein